MPTIHAEGGPASAWLTTLVRPSGGVQAAVAATPAAMSMAIPPHIGICASARSRNVGAAALVSEPIASSVLPTPISALGEKRRSARPVASATPAASGAARIRNCPASAIEIPNSEATSLRIGDMTRMPVWLAKSAKKSTTDGDARRDARRSDDESPGLGADAAVAILQRWTAHGGTAMGSTREWWCGEPNDGWRRIPLRRLAEGQAATGRRALVTRAGHAPPPGQPGGSAGATGRGLGLCFEPGPSRRARQNPVAATFLPGQPPTKLRDTRLHVCDEPRRRCGSQRGHRLELVGERPGASLLGEQVDGERRVAARREATRHRSDRVVEPTVLVDDEQRRRGAGARRSRTPSASGHPARRTWISRVEPRRRLPGATASSTLAEQPPSAARIVALALVRDDAASNEAARGPAHSEHPADECGSTRPSA